jgi:6-pyruvoyltetrahydropterin/6-carboxytetrahydropterin synthase
MHITKEFKFEAAHQLPNHEGKCRNLHGHSYRVEVCVSGEVEVQPVSQQGMVLDFSYLSSIWKLRCEPVLDHQYLNDTLSVPVTTAEHISAWIYAMFANDIREMQPDIGVRLEYVRVWETATSSAIVTADDELVVQA